MAGDGTSADRLVAIVEDDASARAAMVGLVRSLGFATAAFGSAAAFLRSDRVRRTGCLIADMQMPEMTGLELHRRLVATGRPIPTVLVTAHADEAVRALALQAGIRGYLAKPVRPEDLLDVIRAALAQPRP